MFDTDVVEYAGVDVAGTQTPTGLGPDYNNRTDPFDKVSQDETPKSRLELINDFDSTCNSSIRQSSFSL
jgi:hypothetical protein